MTDRPSNERAASIADRQRTPDHQQFQRLLDAYLRALNVASFNDKANAAVAEELAHKIVEAREALYEWARPAAETPGDPTPEDQHSAKVQFAKYHAMQRLLMRVASSPGAFSDDAHRILAGEFSVRSGGAA